MLPNSTGTIVVLHLTLPFPPPEPLRRCYAIRCRNGIVRDAFGLVLDYSNVCIDESRVIKVRITDTCPCNGNEQWCCA
jgi:hypothetical protein